ncbi:platelet-activating factor acetylhydrolase 2, cytoplasmic-like isoform X2 [Narcine bancroftii]|uniref:platelet-activating factor acetylhydrolase 2, cytoplasmic-like isoform X2 n=1 Tax=Narcine bancroftii TaxID=1343680 RepID=UPI003831CFB7
MGSRQSMELPTAKGPFNVGCTDVMVDHRREGSFFRLYYPCEADEQSEQPLWIPRYEYCAGLADYLGKSRMWLAPLLKVAFGYYVVPVGWNAPFRTVEKYPLIIFSHGLGAFRTAYSAICTEMASEGFVVAAVEHRDESAAWTYFFKNANQLFESPQEVICPPATQHELEEVSLPVRKLAAGEEEFSIRNAQLCRRVEECNHALAILTDINSGKSVNNVLLGNLSLSVLKGCIDLQRVAVMGHSFGGSTSVLAVAKDTRFRCAVALDSWMLPLPKDIHSQKLCPVFFINSEKFQTEESIEVMKRLQSTNEANRIITIFIHHIGKSQIIKST